MSKILFLAQVLPYLLHPRVKTYAHYVFRQLARQYEMLLLSFTRDSVEPERYAECL
jgi:hypothetical protein